VTPAWRLIVDGPVAGAENMARDRAVQLAVEAGETPPTLRLYRWARPTVTLGRFQPIEGVDLEAARALGIDVVRRFTGGRGVLHDDELTYAVVARTGDGVPRGVAASYGHLCEPLAEAYRLMGVPAEVTRRDRHASSSSACYLSTTRADLSLGALKLSGSAQVWHGATVLQHGSFTVTRDVEREAAVFRLTADDAALLASTAATIFSATGTAPEPSSLVPAVVQAFQTSLGVTLEPGEMTARELERAADLHAEVSVSVIGQQADV